MRTIGLLNGFTNRFSPKNPQCGRSFCVRVQKKCSLLAIFMLKIGQVMGFEVIETLRIAKFHLSRMRRSVTGDQARRFPGNRSATYPGLPVNISNGCRWWDCTRSGGGKPACNRDSPSITDQQWFSDWHGTIPAKLVRHLGPDMALSFVPNMIEKTN
jgi:hypothetical protein